MKGIKIRGETLLSFKEIHMELLKRVQKGEDDRSREGKLKANTKLKTFKVRDEDNKWKHAAQQIMKRMCWFQY